MQIVADRLKNQNYLEALFAAVAVITGNKKGRNSPALNQSLFRGLGARGPGVDVFDLFRREAINFDAHGLQFQPRNFLIHFLGNGVHTGFELTFVGHQIFTG